MAKVCPMEGCKEHEGMCIHDKMMVAVGVIIVLLIIARFSGLL